MSPWQIRTWRAILTNEWKAALTSGAGSEVGGWGPDQKGSRPGPWVHNYRSTLISGAPPPSSFVYLLTDFSVRTSTPLLQPQQPDQQKPKPLSSRASAFPPIAVCWPQRVQAPGRLTRLPRGSGYRRRLTEPHSKARIWNLFLCSDTLHFICIFTYSEPGVDFLSGWDIAGGWGGEVGRCFHSFSKRFCRCHLETNQREAE